MERKDLYELLDYFQSSKLSKLHYRDGDFEISAEKGNVVALASSSQSEHLEYVQAEQSPVQSSTSDAITAPLVGTFYSSPTPESEPFVKEGQRVKRGDVLCILEAMKTLNELPAPFDCEIVSVCAQNQEFVGFGQQLFEVKKV